MTTTPNNQTVILRGTVVPPVLAYTQNLQLIVQAQEEERETLATSRDHPLGAARTARLHWASLLETPIDFVFQADPGNPGQPAANRRGQLILLDFSEHRETKIAQQIDNIKRTPQDLDRFTGLMQFRVMTACPATLSRISGKHIDALETIQWNDDRSVEYERDSNGALDKGRILPPLSGLESLILHPLTG